MLSAAGTIGCSCGAPGVEPNPDDNKKEKDAGTDSGKPPDLPCGVDCSAIDTPQCKVAVCNTGQEFGPLNTCVVVASSKGAACDDGEFCTTADACDGSGVCVGGTANDCGMDHGPCEAVLCSEQGKSCAITPVNDGVGCTPTDLCKINGVCQTGQCVGETKKCTFSPLAECNTVECDPATGDCAATPDPVKDNAPCVLTGDLCKVDKNCQSGQCVGGADKDCSGFDIECEIGMCDPATGICGPVLGPIGATCTGGVGPCEVGVCNANGECKSKAGPDGTACNDHDACTGADQCVAGVCTDGPPVVGCTHWYQQGFEACPAGWTLAGDWECGEPQNVGPSSAHAGSGVIATKISSVYSVSQAYATATATSPPIDLTTATNPILSFWAWDHTEGGTFDGWNLKVSTDGGSNFSQVMTVTPAYPLSIAGQPAWGGNHSADGWQNYAADLTAYAGQSIILRFAFHSDGAIVYPGVYIDDIVVDEPLQIPIYITTSSPLQDAYTGVSTSVPIARVGGTSNAVWSIVPGGVNTSWLTIDPVTGVLSGTPTPADVGPASVTVHVEEPTLPSNFDEKTFTFNVIYDTYYTSFEGPCPNGWTLAGDWQCGVPVNVGPPTAYLGTQCIGTKIGGNYSDNQTYGGATATSPDFVLGAAPSIMLTFRMWLDTEGVDHDGVNLWISNDGGATYTLVNSVAPPYPLIIAGQAAWGGQQSGFGWQLMQADLSAYAGQTVRLRFAFRSDSSGTFPGVYIDDFFVN